MKKLSITALAFALLMTGAVTLFERTVHASNSPDVTGTAPYRDGKYQGRLAAKSGSAPHLAIGRWSTTADRSSFTAGYQQGYGEVDSAGRDVNRATSAAFRDGLFLGSRAVAKGDQPHLSVGRWATDADRDLFTEGYHQGYTQTLLAQAANSPRSSF